MRARSIIVAAVLLAAFWFQAAGIARAMMRDWVDDAFFYVIVADSVVEGRGSTSDGIGATNGYHPLWMAVHVLVRAVTTNPLPVLAVLQFVLLAAALLLLHRWLAPLSGPGIALILCLVAVYERSFARVLATGMETHLAFVALLAVLLLLRRGDTRGPALQAALLALFFARLDGGLLWVVLAVLLLRKEGFAPVLRLFAVPASMAGVYLSWNLVAFGTAMPISGRIKATDWRQLADLVPGFDRLLLLFVPQTFDWPARLTPWDPFRSGASTTIWILYLLAVALALAVWLRLLAREGKLDLAVRVLVGYGLLHALYYSVLQRDRYSLSWARGPELLLLTTCVASLLVRMARPLLALPGMARVARAATAGAVLVLFASMWAHFRYEAHHAGTIRDYTTGIDQFDQGVAWVRAHTGAQEVIASESIGFLGWFADRPIVSLDGLLNSLPYYRDYLRPRRVGTYLREHGVRYIAQALRKDVEPLPYMSDVLHVPAHSLRVVASFEGTERNPRRYLVFELSRSVTP